MRYFRLLKLEKGTITHEDRKILSFRVSPALNGSMIAEVGGLEVDVEAWTGRVKCAEVTPMTALAEKNAALLDSYSKRKIEINNELAALTGLIATLTV